VKVLYCARVCESASLRHSLVMKQVWSPDLRVHGELIWSRVGPNRASCLGLIRTHYSQETPKSPQGEQLEMGEASGIVFPCVPERRTPYLLSTALIPSIFISV
jgi:hypothetical protein